MYSRLPKSHSKLWDYEMPNTMKNSFKSMVSKDLGEIVVSLYLWRVMEKFREPLSFIHTNPCTFSYNYVSVF